MTSWRRLRESISSFVTLTLVILLLRNSSSLNEVSEGRAAQSEPKPIPGLTGRRPGRPAAKARGPIVITKGGTYRGDWESDDPDEPAVTIRTAEPVVIRGATIRSRGHLIATDGPHAKLIVRDCTGYGLNPRKLGRSAGRFLIADGFDSITVENNYLEGTAGIWLHDYRGGQGRGRVVEVIGNRARNIDGRKSDGGTGYLEFNQRTDLRTGRAEMGYDRVQFLQMDGVRNVPRAEIAWNEVINEPGRSRVEDNINIYLSCGTKSAPIRIHDNFIKGAYTIRPWQGDEVDATWKHDWGFAGGGILLGDGKAATARDSPSWTVAYQNQVVSTTNYAIAIAAGHDNAIRDNRMLSSDRLDDGRMIIGENSGAYIWDSYHQGPGFFHRNQGEGNLVGWQQGAARRDWWTPDALKWNGNDAWPGPITLDGERAEYALWKEKVARARRKVGPTGLQGP